MSVYYTEEIIGDEIVLNFYVKGKSLTLTAVDREQANKLIRVFKFLTGAK